ncbi:hypothetical protein AMS68_006686 [Peltaster fructicola]|uniref:Zn(2)-C6 fungal-type domain-containing protein n=1 Tax=Peltaster fructicola TaxID=286661 RepID=A0A6H0Y2T8_9PEZI|nr:hypothetical protein AMS68_006686 [Peltaster fructicola]
MASDANFQVFSIHDEYNVREYRKRRLHSKTHTGCAACRSKRVKCDENKPICTRCVRNDRACVYESAIPTELCRDRSHDIKVIAGIVHEDTPCETGVPTSVLMQHCRAQWDSIFDIAAKDEVLAMSEQHPVLYKTLLAMSACHLRRVSPSTQHRIAEHYYQSSALHECQQQICVFLHNLDQADLEVLGLSALLLNMIAFALPEDEEKETDLSKTWVFSTDEDRLGWLTLLEGLRHLFMAAGLHLPTMMKFMVRLCLGQKEVPRVWVAGDFAEVPEHWRTFFDLDNPELATLSGCHTGLSRASIFRPAINVLLKTKRPITQGRVYHFFPFFLKVNTDLRSLLLARDGQALWLLGYWYALMLHCDNLWWSHGRVRRDYKAIRLWLEQSGLTSQEDEIGASWRVMMDELDSVAQH